MTSELQNFLVTILFAVPVAAVFAERAAWTVLWALIGLALLAWAPALAIVAGLVWLLRTPLRWVLEGFFIGEGVKASGVVRRLSQRPQRSRHWTRSAPRGRGRRLGEYMPWEAEGDDLPEL
ncbi:MAG: hypothetical protein WBE80_10200 [Methylocella sp.]